MKVLVLSRVFRRSVVQPFVASELWLRKTKLQSIESQSNMLPDSVKDEQRSLSP